MKRRKFFGIAASTAIGLTVPPSCLSSQEEKKAKDSKSTTDLLNQEPPAYRKKIKSSFVNNKLKSAGDTIIVALIGAGGWGIEEMEKIQGYKPIRVRDMRTVFDDKDVYVEKCISHNIFEGQKMIEAAMKYEQSFSVVPKTEVHRRRFLQEITFKVAN